MSILAVLTPPPTPALFSYFTAFGVLTLVGGIMGYVKAQSTASLVAGGVSGILLILGAILTMTGPWTAGVVLCLLLSLLLLGRFAPALLRGKLNPAAYVAPLALIGVVLTVWAVVAVK